jgi:flagellar basal-body rod modification protein FlgD
VSSATDGITGPAGSSGSSTAASTSVADRISGMGRDAFLQLLVTQLSHQNPLQPQADGEFIAQLAQFSSLEQLTTMNTTLNRMARAMGVAPVVSE